MLDLHKHSTFLSIYCLLLALQTLPSTHQTTTLPLLVKPDVYLEKQIQVTEGEPTLAIPCTADGIPMPTIKWTTAGVMTQ